jgi:multiple sugar transport system substrate-binding protein
MAGFTAIQESGIWSISQVTDSKKDFKYGVFPLPVPPGGHPSTDLGGWAVAANAKGKNPEAAAKFVVWALGTSDPACIERNRAWAADQSSTPSRASVSKAALAHGDFDNPIFKEMAGFAPTGQAEPRYPPEVMKIISDGLQAAQLGGVSGAQAAADSSGKLDAFLKTYSGAPMG